MNCKDFEKLLPDALGDELTETDRRLLDAHVAACASCRTEYNALQATLSRLGELSAPRPARVRREGNGLIPLDETRARSPIPKRLAFNVFRYAASVLFAFTAGYAMHAWLMVAEAGSIETHPARSGRQTLRVAVANAHQRNPSGSDLAKCMSALFDTGSRRRP